MNGITRRGFTFTVAGALARVGMRGQDAGGLTEMTLAEASAKIKAGTVSSVQLTEACLARIATYSPKLNAFITVMKEQALGQAKAMDAERKAGKLRGPLHGIPIALKDNIDTAGTRTTAASAVYDDRIPTEDAEVVRKLKAAGAVTVGKANLHEFAFGGTSATSYFGPVRDPWALDRTAGGSSGGSAAAVAADLCYGALSTDTGGSIRTPASYCGVVGLMPTYGLVSIRGIIPLVVSLDHCGPITRTVEDAALMLNVLRGYDKLDITSVPHEKEDYLAGMRQPVGGLRIGVPRAPFFDHLDADVEKAVEAAIAKIGGMVKSVKECSLPSTSGMSTGGETYAYHQEMYEHGAARYQIPTRRSLANGANVKAVDYIKGRWKLELLRRTIDDAFSDFDLVVLPTRRHTPRTINDAKKREETEKMRNPELENTGQFDAYGVPAISVPCGFSADKVKVPIGLMIAGPHFSEGRVLALAHAYEQATEWHKERPPLTPETPVPVLAVTDAV